MRPDDPRRAAHGVSVLVSCWLFVAGPLMLMAWQAAGADGYAGSQACQVCHEQEFSTWQGSHHDLAMQPATAQTVLGDFADARFEHGGVVTHFQRRDDRYLVVTQGGDGEVREYEVAYTFGVTPLQQYLLALPGGRYQALTVAWDTRPQEQGGQRWFHLYPQETIPPGDELHWTAPAHNWNFSCAECHSTDLRKNYDAVNDSYATGWAEIDVACEACHGPAAAHVAAATAAQAGADYPADHALVVELGGPGEWEYAAGRDTALQRASGGGASEVELCGRCHARRSQLVAEYRHGDDLSASHRVELLEPGYYHADGQILDEVYVYGSFRQSRMYAAGVTCSDCHDPHSLRLRADGDALCLTCHAAPAFAVESHHHHPVASTGARCVACHMPARNYMVVDPRRDHSLRIPRPDLTVALGVPNACNGCHETQDADWAAEAVAGWTGRPPGPGFQDYANVLQAARDGEAGAGEALTGLVTDGAIPAIVRATALAALAAYLQPAVLPAIQAGVADPDPLVRRAATQAVGAAAPITRWQLLNPLLDDPVRGVRIAAAAALSDIQPAQLDTARGARLQQGFDEYLASERFNADRAEHWVNVAAFHQRQGDAVTASEAYREARRRNPRFAPAYVNEADFLRASGDEPGAGRVIRDGLAVVPDNAALHHALGLWLVRAQRHEDALDELRQSFELGAEDPRNGYVYGIALSSSGQPAAATAVWRQVLERHHNDRETLLALATTLAETGQPAAALVYARRLQDLQPGDARIADLVSNLEAAGQP